MNLLALDLGGTKTTAALVELSPAGDARILQRVTSPTPAREGAARVLENALELATSLADGRGRGHEPIRAVGVASAGVVDVHRGVVPHATDALPGWPGTDLVSAFSTRFGLPAVALNDVHAHGLGEARFGAGAGRGSILLVAIGTGIGGCLVVEGRPLFGARGVAGHLGHLTVPEADGVTCSCGRTGHLEGLASGPGIHALYLRRGGRAADAREIAQRAASGEKLATVVLRECGFATGRVLGGLMNAIDPEVVVLTGGVSQIGEPWLGAVREGITHDAMDAVAGTPVLPAHAGVEAALLGAAAFAQDELTRGEEV